MVLHFSQCRSFIAFYTILISVPRIFAYPGQTGSYGAFPGQYPGMGAGQPIMPINSSPYGQAPMTSQFNPQITAQFQRQYAGGQQMGPMGLQSGRIPQDMIQQQMLMQMYQQQQQRYDSGLRL